MKQQGEGQNHPLGVVSGKIVLPGHRIIAVRRHACHQTRMTGKHKMHADSIPLRNCATEPAVKSLDSNTQTATPFGAARTYDGAATAGTHAHEKTVSTFATHNGRLISAFHDNLPFKRTRDYSFL